MKNKVPTRLSAQAKQQRVYESVTSRKAIVFPNERAALGVKTHVRAKHCKKFCTTQEPRGF